VTVGAPNVRGARLRFDARGDLSFAPQQGFADQTQPFEDPDPVLTAPEPLLSYQVEPAASRFRLARTPTSVRIEPG